MGTRWTPGRRLRHALLVAAALCGRTAAEARAATDVSVAVRPATPGTAAAPAPVGLSLRATLAATSRGGLPPTLRRLAIGLPAGFATALEGTTSCPHAVPTCHPAGDADLRAARDADRERHSDRPRRGRRPAERLRGRALVRARPRARRRGRPGTLRIRRAGGRALRGGRYRARVRAIDAAGLQSAKRTVAFTLR